MDASAGRTLGLPVRLAHIHQPQSLGLVPIVSLLLLTSSSIGGCITTRNGEHGWFPRWDSLDLAEAALLVGLSATDAGLSAAKLGERTGCRESDPIVRFAASTDRPSSADFAISAIVGIALGLVVAEILPHPWRKLWLLGGLGLEAYEVGRWAALDCSPAAPTASLAAPPR